MVSLGYTARVVNMTEKPDTYLENWCCQRTRGVETCMGNDDWEIEDMIRETTGEKEVITKIGIDSQPRMIMSMVR